MIEGFGVEGVGLGFRLGVKFFASFFSGEFWEYGKGLSFIYDLRWVGFMIPWLLLLVARYKEAQSE